MCLDDEDFEDIFCHPTGISAQEQNSRLIERVNELRSAIRAQNEEVADLIHENRTLKNNTNSYVKKHAELAKDANRYRWIRNTAMTPGCVKKIIRTSGEELDKAIDAEMEFERERILIKY